MVESTGGKYSTYVNDLIDCNNRIALLKDKIKNDK